jgi:hypothetical protein
MCSPKEEAHFYYSDPGKKKPTWRRSYFLWIGIRMMRSERENVKNE